MACAGRFGAAWLESPWKQDAAGLRAAGRAAPNDRWNHASGAVGTLGRVKHYPSMDRPTRDRLLARGIEPEASTTQFLEAIRTDFDLDKLTRNLGFPARWKIVPGLPLAMVLTTAEHAALLSWRLGR